MFHWFFIILGILFLSLSLSNPIYNLIVKKKIHLSVVINFLFRVIGFFIGIILIFIGLYLESLG